MKRLTRFFSAALIVSAFTLAPVSDSEAWFNMSGPWNDGWGNRWGGGPWGGNPWNSGYGWGGGPWGYNPWNRGWGGGPYYGGGAPYYGGGAPYYGGGEAVEGQAPSQYPETTPVD